MVEILCIAFIVSVAAVSALLIMLKGKNEDLTQSKTRLAETMNALTLAKLELIKRNDELKARQENRRNADEKIHDLRTGDALANAINGLSKHGNSDSGESDSSER